MIISFKCEDTRRLFETGRSKRFANIKTIAERKLTLLGAAVTLSSLKAPPGNRLEALLGDRKGQHSIRINDQWRICFEWTDKGPANIEIVDYN
jgi:toxin HigB-1